MSRLRSMIITSLMLASFQSYGYTLSQCYYLASQTFGVPVKLMYAITKVESDFQPYCINENGHGTSVWSKCYGDFATAYYTAKDMYDRGDNIDIGLMQINSENIRDHGWSLASVLDPCTNVFYGAYLLRENINRYGFNWRAVWHYNGRRDYAFKVFKALEYINSVMR